MCVGGDGCVGVPISLFVCVCVCFLEGHTRKRCIDAIYFGIEHTMGATNEAAH